MLNEHIVWYKMCRGVDRKKQSLRSRKKHQTTLTKAYYHAPTQLHIHKFNTMEDVTHNLNTMEIAKKDVLKDVLWFSEMRSRGKSRWVDDNYPNSFHSTGSFGGYNGQNTVVFDELNAYTFGKTKRESTERLLSLLRRDCEVATDRGQVQFKPSLIIITTNLEAYDIVCCITDKDWEKFTEMVSFRRINTYKYVDEWKKW